MALTPNITSMMCNRVSEEEKRLLGKKKRWERGGGIKEDTHTGEKGFSKKLSYIRDRENR